METPVTLSPSLVYLPRDFHHLVYLSLDCWWLPRAGTGRGGVGISFAAAEATYHIPPLKTQPSSLASLRSRSVFDYPKVEMSQLDMVILARPPR